MSPKNSSLVLASSLKTPVMEDVIVDAEVF